MVFDELTDEELMTMYQNGSEEAFKCLYQRHSSKIYGFLKARVRPHEKVSEIYQEVFVKIHKSKHLYNKSLPLLPWIFTVTRNVMLDELKKEKKHMNQNDSDLHLIQSEAVITEISSPAFTKIQLLPEAQRIAVQMRYVDDKTFDEIAENLKTSSSNVRQIVSRGIKRLKELIREDD